MRRAAKWIGWTLSGLVAVPILLILVVLVGANTEPGRHFIERITPQLTGDTVRLAGISGRFPDGLRIARAELRDPQGDYATIEEFALDWSPAQLLHRQIVVDRLAAARIDVARPPVSSSSGGSYSLPAPVVLHELRIDRVDVAAPVAGTAVSVALDGSGALQTLTQGRVTLNVRQLDGAGSYTLDAAMDAGGLHATLKATEPAHGMVASIAGLPDLGAIDLAAKLDGPQDAVATHVVLSAGPLHATADGALDLEHSAADLALSASAPAMRPRPDIAWQAVTLDAHVKGPFAQPDATGRLHIDALAAAAITVASVTASVSGNAGRVHLDGELLGLHVPAPNPDLFAGDPIIVSADARLDAPDRPVHVTLHHKLVEAEADARTAGALGVDATVTLAELAPFAAMSGLDLQGRLKLGLHAAVQADTTTIGIDGTVGVTGGMQQIQDLIGDNGHLSLAATLRGRDLTLSHLQFDGRSLTASASGAVAHGQVDLTWSLGVSDLAAAKPTLAGQLAANGHASGTTDDLDLTADMSGGITVRGMSSGTLASRIAVHGLPKNADARITARGSLLDAPIELAIALRQQADGLSVDIERADWKSAHAEGAMSLPTATMVPAGHLKIAMARLDELAPLLGRQIAGSVTADLDASPAKARLTVDVQGAALPGTAVASRIALTADVDQPESHPVVDARLEADGIRAKQIAGSMRLQVNGPVDALALKLSATLPELSGAAARLDAAAVLNAGSRVLSVSTLQTDWHQQSLRLLAPARFDFAEGVAFDRLRLGLRQAVLDVSGRIGTALDLTVSLRNLPADLAAAIAPDYAFDGTLQADARITGTTAQPAGTVKLTATGLRARNGPGRGIPPASITADATLKGTEAQVDAQVHAGSSQVRLAGRVPMSSTGALDLRVSGAVDLAMANPILAAGGQRVRGRLTPDLTIAGTVAAPQVTGTVLLADGEVQDAAAGLHLSDIVARVQGDGNTLRITQFSAKAGPGTIGGGGSIGVLAPGLPLDLTLTARNARPLSSDLISAELDADLTIRGDATGRGDAAGQLTIAGSLRVRRADLRVPERLPSSVAVLPIAMPGAKPPPSSTSAAALVVALNLTLDAPQQIFVRGRGLDVEFGGSMKLTGTTARLQAIGSLNLRRGVLNLAGRALDFKEGAITFNGSSITDPGIHLVAASTSANVVATLAVDGTAHDPKITLSSVPELPQDEVLAHLLFGKSVGSLGPLEIAGIATGLATITGAGGGIGDPLDKMRQGLGLDRLAVGSNAKGGATLEAGRYLAPGVYLGAKQSASGGGAQASVQVDIAKGLKLEGTAGTGGTSAVGAAGASNGTSVGLTYQFEY
jgi:translocation and assembly module TamB